ncbi:hypothetical protein A2U01_0106577, partial [Trifolium medium]|nr:hypothetical protein [Trifolium medium]
TDVSDNWSDNWFAGSI